MGAEGAKSAARRQGDAQNADGSRAVPGIQRVVNGRLLREDRSGRNRGRNVRRRESGTKRRSATGTNKEERGRTGGRGAVEPQRGH